MLNQVSLLTYIEVTLKNVLIINFDFHIVTLAIERSIYKNCKQYLVLDVNIKHMLSQILYWDKHLTNEYSRDRQRKLNTLDNLFPIMEDIGINYLFHCYRKILWKSFKECNIGWKI